VKPGTQKDVAEAILALTYVEMMEFADSFAAHIKTDIDEETEVDLTNRDEVADRMRWWAEGYLDALRDK